MNNIIEELRTELTQHLNTTAKSVNSLISAFQLLARLVSMFETEDHLSFVRDALTLVLTQLEATHATLVPQLNKVQTVMSQPATAQTSSTSSSSAPSVDPATYTDVSNK